MNSSTTKTREFPALLMTALFVGASLASIGCLRKMNEQPLLSSTVVYDASYFDTNSDASYDANLDTKDNAGPDFQLALKATAKNAGHQTR